MCLINYSCFDLFPNLNTVQNLPNFFPIILNTLNTSSIGDTEKSNDSSQRIIADVSFMLSSLISDPASAHSTAMRPKWWSHWPPAMSQNKGQKLEYNQGFAEGKDTLHIPPFFNNNSHCVPKLLTKRNRLQNKKTQNIRQYLNELVASGSRHVILTELNDISRLHTWIGEVL